MSDEAPSSEESLRGLRVLATRPLPANEHLVNAIRQRGGEALCLPAVQTRAVPSSILEAQVAHLEEVALAIFVSVPAVEHGHGLLGDGNIRARKIAAIGRTTAEALQARGITVAFRPENDAYTSEALLDHPALAAGELSGDVLIIRGVGGRELLADTLRQRGLGVHYAQTYERHCPPMASGARTRALLRATEAPHIITATSLEILDNALLLLGDEAIHVKSASRVLVPSDRIAQAATGRAGFQLPPLKSRGADNEALVSAMEAWWGTR